MPRYLYHATSLPSTAVLFVAGPLHFTAAVPEVLVAKSSRLEVHRCGEAGLKLQLEYTHPINGRIAALQVVRRRSGLDAALLYFEHQQLIVLRWDAVSRAMLVVAACSFSHLHHRPVDQADQVLRSACDPCGRVVAFFAHEGLIHFVDTRAAFQSADGGAVDLVEEGRLFSKSLVEHRVLDLAFLDLGTDAKGIVLAILLADGDNGRVCLCTIDVERRQVVPMAVPALSAWAALVREPASDEGASALPAGEAAEAAPSSRAAEGADMPQVAPLGLEFRSCRVLSAGASAQRLAPLSAACGGGCLVLGGRVVEFLRGEGLASVFVAPAHGLEEVADVAPAPGAPGRWLAAAPDGGLWLVALDTAGQALTVTLRHLGAWSPARALAWLPGDVALVGSACGDSQVLRIPADGGFAEIADAWPNLGPILDFCVADIDGRSSNQVVTCSGIGATGSLRFVRVGVDFRDITLGKTGEDDGGVGVPCFGATGLWPLEFPGDRGTLLVVSFANSTRALLLSQDGASLQEALASDLAPLPEQSLLCLAPCLPRRPFVLQVVGSEVRALCPDRLVHLSGASWRPPPGRRIDVAAAAAAGAVAVACCGGEVLLLDVEPTAPKLAIAASWHMPSDVACLHSFGDLLAVGTWDSEVRIMSRSSSEVCVKAIGDHTIPRSLLFARFAGLLHLLVAMGDGWVMSFRGDERTGQLDQRRAFCLGSQPPRLSAFRAGSEEEHVFVAGSRPAVLRSGDGQSGRLVCLPVNLGLVTHFATFEAQPVAGLVVVLADGRISVGELEDIRRVHVQTLPLGVSPHRICWHAASRGLVVACEPEAAGKLAASGAQAGADAGGGTLRLVHGPSMLISQIVTLSPQEHVSSLCALPGADAVGDAAASELIAVGTAFVRPGEPEPVDGRVLLYKVKGEAAAARLALVGEQDVRGAVYSLAPLRGMLVGSVNNQVRVWRYGLSPLLAAAFAPPPRTGTGGSGLREVASYCGHLCIALYVKALGDSVLVGDVMRSATLLRCRRFPPPPPPLSPPPPSLAASSSSTGPAHAESELAVELEEVAQDESVSWLTAAEMLGEDCFLCADDYCNLFALELPAPSSPAMASGAGPTAPAQRRPAAPGMQLRIGLSGAAADGGKLRRVAGSHTGEFVNRLQRACLVQHPEARQGAPELGGGCRPGEEGALGMCVLDDQVIWASVDGAIGVVLPLRSEDDYKRLCIMQAAVASALPAAAGATHDEWRAFRSFGGATERPPVPGLDAAVPGVAFVDGDLLERVLHLPRAGQRLVVDRMRAFGTVPGASFGAGAGRGCDGTDGVEALLLEADELSRLH